jgi:O-glycosyl hydrolase
MASRRSWVVSSASFIALTLVSAIAAAQSVTVDTSASGKQQTIDGFGTCLSGTEALETWFSDLFLDDLRASILRFDIVPRFKAPYSDFTYNSPWFHNNPALPGPDNNNVRTYTNATDYTRSFAGRNAAIAVMGPNIDQNVAYFDYQDDVPRTAGLLAQQGVAKKAELGDFKLIASMWSPPPWLKLSSGNTISGQSGIFPVNGTPWPFIWGGNFSGGKLDTSGTARAEFDDSSLGGTGPTSALVQFARALAAYLRGFQQAYGVELYAISIQNELNFETFYNSCTYALSSEYIAALKAARTELDKYDDLRAIRIMGPEDLLGGDGYGMWQYGGGADVTHKNLQYLSNIAADTQAAQAIDFFCIHGYAPDGVSSAGSNPQTWDWWANGWSTSPAAGLPATVQGFSGYSKKSWMTETSGESSAWLEPASGFPSQGAFSIAIKIHQALTTGRESAWVYWQLTDGSAVAEQTLTDATLRGTSPKYVAAKHFFHYIRPNAYRVQASVSGASSLYASAYVHDADGTLTVVLINADASDVTATLAVPDYPSGLSAFEARTSSDGSYWQTSTLTAASQALSVPIPGYGVVTLSGQGVGSAGSGGTGGGGGTAGTGGAAGLTGGAGGLGAQGGAGGSAATAGTLGAGANAGASASGAASEDDGGCGCRVSAARGTHSLLWLAAALGAIAIRRARARARD